MKGNEEEAKGPEGLLSAPARLPHQSERRAFGQVVVGAFFTPQTFTFKPNELRFLKEFGPDTAVEDAAKKAGVPVEYCNRMLRKKAVQEFLQDKFQQVAIQQGWTVERWFAEGDKVWRGQKIVTREQLDIWKEFGSRILPKTKGTAGADGTEKPQITINIGAVDEAFRRQAEITAEIIDTTGGTVQ